MKTERFKPDEVARALVESGGIISTAADALGITPKAVYGYMRRHPELEDCIRAGVEFRLDRAIAQLYKAIDSGNITAIFYELNNRGQKRGYNRKDNDGQLRVVFSSEQDGDTTAPGSDKPFEGNPYEEDDGLFDEAEYVTDESEPKLLAPENPDLP